MSSGSVLKTSIVVIEEMAIDHIGELPLEAALGLLGGFELGDLAVVVLASGSAIASLDDGCGVESGVELAIPSAVQPMTANVATRSLDWCRAGVAGEMALGFESSDVDSVPNDLGGEDWAHALDVGRGGGTDCNLRSDAVSQRPSAGDRHVGCRREGLER